MTLRALFTAVCALLILATDVRGTQVVQGNVRITVVTPNLIRIEQAPAGKFIDDKSLFAVNREARFAGAKVQHHDGDRESVVIDTGPIRLKFAGRGETMTPDRLYAEIRHGDRWVSWKLGDRNPGNLGGTIRTLDGVYGPVDVGEGVLSRDGWYLLDDSRTPLLTDDGWVRARPADAGTDWYLFGYGTDFRAALKSLTTIGGPVPMPRRYVLGAWYSRYWAYTSDDFKQIVREYERHGFPLDVIVMDMDWHVTKHPDVQTRHGGQIWTGYTWDKSLIPDPKALINWFHGQGLRVTLNDHPADGVQPHEALYDDFMRDMGVSTATSRPTIPFDAGDRKYLDTFWKHTHQPLLDMGVDFWWLDWQQYPFTRSIAELTNLAWLNHYYFAQTARNGQRGASFSRWAGWGDHRHPIHFSGDASTGWDMLAFEVPFTSTAGNVGCFFWSHDIGGHMGGRNEESYARWCQFGALSAALRSHSTRDATMDRRPWTYPDWAEESMRRSFRLRSEMFPYIYTGVAQSCRDSVPLVRPMYIDYGGDENSYQNPQQYLLGDHVLAAPIASAGTGPERVAQQVVWFPPGDDWFDYFTGERFHGGTERLVGAAINAFPLYIRGGVPIPMQPYTPRMASSELRTLVLRVYPGADGKTTVTHVYEDDGISENYLRGESATTALSYTRKGGQHIIEVLPREGTFPGAVDRREVIVELGATKAATIVTVDGAPATSEHDARSAVNRVRVAGHDVRQRFTVTITAEDQPRSSQVSPHMGAFDKREAPSGFPAHTRRYFYGAGPGGEVRWKLIAGRKPEVRVLAECITPASPKMPLPSFGPLPLPTGLDERIALVAEGLPPGQRFSAMIPVPALDPIFNRARSATVTASSTETGYSPAGATDGSTAGYPHGKQSEWASNGEKAGATVTLSWDEPQIIDTVHLYDRPNLTDRVCSAVLVLDGGAPILVGELPNDGKQPLEVSVPPRPVKRVELRITGVSTATQNAGISEIAVFRTDRAGPSMSRPTTSP